MRSRILLSVVLGSAALCIGGAAAFLLIRLKPEAPTAPDDRPPMLVRGVRLTPGPIEDRLVAYGSARADRFARVSSEVNGVIEHISDNLRPGATVAADEVLIRLDQRETQAALLSARASLRSDEAALAKLDIEGRNLKELQRIAQVELDVAQRELGRVQRLFDNGLAGRRELDAAQVDVEAKQRTLQNLRKQHQFLPETRRQHEAMVALRKANVALAELNVERTTIRAPFAGRIEDVRVELGERINAGAWLFSVLDPDLIEIPVEAPMAWHDRVAVGNPVDLTLENGSASRWRGVVKRIAPSGDTQTRTFALYVEVDNRTQSEPLLPGAFLRAVVVVERIADALVLPRSCVQREQVFVYDDGVARRLPVEVRRTIFDRCLVRGAPAGSIVITSNLDALTDGLPVRVDLGDQVLEPNRPAPPVAQHDSAFADVTPQ